MGLRDRARESTTKGSREPGSEQPKAEPEPSQAPEETPAPKEPGGPGGLEASMTYLVEEERPDQAYKLFTQPSRQGTRGVIVSRTYPKNLRKALDLGAQPLF